MSLLHCTSSDASGSETGSTIVLREGGVVAEDAPPKQHVTPPTSNNQRTPSANIRPLPSSNGTRAKVTHNRESHWLACQADWDRRKISASSCPAVVVLVALLLIVAATTLRNVDGRRSPGMTIIDMSSKKTCPLPSAALVRRRGFFRQGGVGQLAYAQTYIALPPRFHDPSYVNCWLFDAAASNNFEYLLADSQPQDFYTANALCEAQRAVLLPAPTGVAMLDAQTVPLTFRAWVSLSQVKLEAPSNWTHGGSNPNATSAMRAVLSDADDILRLRPTVASPELSLPGDRSNTSLLTFNASDLAVAGNHFFYRNGWQATPPAASQALSAFQMMLTRSTIPSAFSSVPCFVLGTTSPLTAAACNDASAAMAVCRRPARQPGRWWAHESSTLAVTSSSAMFQNMQRQLLERGWWDPLVVGSSTATTRMLFTVISTPMDRASAMTACGAIDAVLACVPTKEVMNNVIFQALQQSTTLWYSNNSLPPPSACAMQTRGFWTGAWKPTNASEVVCYNAPELSDTIYANRSFYAIVPSPGATSSLNTTAGAVSWNITSKKFEFKSGMITVKLPAICSRTLRSATVVDIFEPFSTTTTTTMDAAFPTVGGMLRLNISVPRESLVSRVDTNPSASTFFVTSSNSSVVLPLATRVVISPTSAASFAYVDVLFVGSGTANLTVTVGSPDYIGSLSWSTSINNYYYNGNAIPLQVTKRVVVLSRPVLQWQDSLSSTWSLAAAPPRVVLYPGDTAVIPFRLTVAAPGNIELVPIRLRVNVSYRNNSNSVTTAKTFYLGPTSACYGFMWSPLFSMNPNVMPAETALKSAAASVAFARGNTTSLLTVTRDPFMTTEQCFPGLVDAAAGFFNLSTTALVASIDLIWTLTVDFGALAGRHFLRPYRSASGGSTSAVVVNKLDGSEDDALSHLTVAGINIVVPSMNYMFSQAASPRRFAASPDRSLFEDGDMITVSLSLQSGSATFAMPNVSGAFLATAGGIESLGRRLMNLSIANVLPNSCGYYLQTANQPSGTWRPVIGTTVAFDMSATEQTLRTVYLRTNGLLPQSWGSQSCFLVWQVNDGFTPWLALPPPATAVSVLKRLVFDTDITSVMAEAAEGFKIQLRNYRHIVPGYAVRVTIEFGGSILNAKISATFVGRGNSLYCDVTSAISAGGGDCPGFLSWQTPYDPFRLTGFGFIRIRPTIIDAKGLISISMFDIMFGKGFQHLQYIGFIAPPNKPPGSGGGVRPGFRLRPFSNDALSVPIYRGVAFSFSVGINATLAAVAAKLLPFAASDNPSVSLSGAKMCPEYCLGNCGNPTDRLTVTPNSKCFEPLKSPLGISYVATMTVMNMPVSSNPLRLGLDVGCSSPCASTSYADLKGLNLQALPPFSVQTVARTELITGLKQTFGVQMFGSNPKVLVSTQPIGFFWHNLSVEEWNSALKLPFGSNAVTHPSAIAPNRRLNAYAASHLICASVDLPRVNGTVALSFSWSVSPRPAESACANLTTSLVVVGSTLPNCVTIVPIGSCPARSGANGMKYLTVNVTQTSTDWNYANGTLLSTFVLALDVVPVVFVSIEFVRRNVVYLGDATPATPCVIRITLPRNPIPLGAWLQLELYQAGDVMPKIATAVNFNAGGASSTATVVPRWIGNLTSSNGTAVTVTVWITSFAPRVYLRLRVVNASGCTAIFNVSRPIADALFGADVVNANAATVFFAPEAMLIIPVFRKPTMLMAATYVTPYSRSLGGGPAAAFISGLSRVSDDPPLAAAFEDVSLFASMIPGGFSFQNVTIRAWGLGLSADGAGATDRVTISTNAGACTRLKCVSLTPGGSFSPMRPAGSPAMDISTLPLATAVEWPLPTTAFNCSFDPLQLCSAPPALTTNAGFATDISFTTTIELTTGIGEPVSFIDSVTSVSTVMFAPAMPFLHPLSMPSASVAYQSTDPVLPMNPSVWRPKLTAVVPSSALRVTEGGRITMAYVNQSSNHTDGYLEIGYKPDGSAFGKPLTSSAPMFGDVLVTGNLTYAKSWGQLSMLQRSDATTTANVWLDVLPTVASYVDGSTAFVVMPLRAAPAIWINNSTGVLPQSGAMATTYAAGVSPSPPFATAAPYFIRRRLVPVMRLGFPKTTLFACEQSLQAKLIVPTPPMTAVAISIMSLGSRCGSITPSNVIVAPATSSCPALGECTSVVVVPILWTTAASRSASVTCEILLSVNDTFVYTDAVFVSDAVAIVTDTNGTIDNSADDSAIWSANPMGQMTLDRGYAFISLSACSSDHSNQISQSLSLQVVCDGFLNGTSVITLSGLYDRTTCRVMANGQPIPIPSVASGCRLSVTARWRNGTVARVFQTIACSYNLSYVVLQGVFPFGMGVAGALSVGTSVNLTTGFANDDAEQPVVFPAAMMTVKLKAQENVTAYRGVTGFLAKGYVSATSTRASIGYLQSALPFFKGATVDRLRAGKSYDIKFSVSALPKQGRQLNLTVSCNYSTLADRSNLVPCDAGWLWPNGAASVNLSWTPTDDITKVVTITPNTSIPHGHEILVVFSALPISNATEGGSSAIEFTPFRVQYIPFVIERDDTFVFEPVPLRSWNVVPVGVPAFKYGYRVLPPSMITVKPAIPTQASVVAMLLSPGTLIQTFVTAKALPDNRSFVAIFGSPAQNETLSISGPTKPDGPQQVVVNFTVVINTSTSSPPQTVLFNITIDEPRKPFKIEGPLVGSRGAGGLRGTPALFVHWGDAAGGSPTALSITVPPPNNSYPPYDTTIDDEDGAGGEEEVPDEGGDGGAPEGVLASPTFNCTVECALQAENVSFSSSTMANLTINFSSADLVPLLTLQTNVSGTPSAPSSLPLSWQSSFDNVTTQRFFTLDAAFATSVALDPVAADRLARVEQVTAALLIAPPAALMTCRFAFSNDFTADIFDEYEELDQHQVIINVTVSAPFPVILTANSAQRSASNGNATTTESKGFFFFGENLTLSARSAQSPNMGALCASGSRIALTITGVHSGPDLATTVWNGAYDVTTPPLSPEVVVAPLEKWNLSVNGSFAVLPEDLVAPSGGDANSVSFTDKWVPKAHEIVLSTKGSTCRKYAATARAPLTILQPAAVTMWGRLTDDNSNGEMGGGQELPPAELPTAISGESKFILLRVPIPIRDFPADVTHLSVQWLVEDALDGALSGSEVGVSIEVRVPQFPRDAILVNETLPPLLRTMENLAIDQHAAIMADAASLISRFASVISSIEMNGTKVLCDLRQSQNITARGDNVGVKGTALWVPLVVSIILRGDGGASGGVNSSSSRFGKLYGRVDAVSPSTTERGHVQLFASKLLFNAHNATGDAETKAATEFAFAVILPPPPTPSAVNLSATSPSWLKTLLRASASERLRPLNITTYLGNTYTMTATFAMPRSSLILELGGGESPLLDPPEAPLPIATLLPWTFDIPLATRDRLLLSGIRVDFSVSTFDLNAAAPVAADMVLFTQRITINCGNVSSTSTATNEDDVVVDLPLSLLSSNGTNLTARRPLGGGGGLHYAKTLQLRCVPRPIVLCDMNGTVNATEALTHFMGTLDAWPQLSPAGKAAEIAQWPSVGRLSLRLSRSTLTPLTVTVDDRFLRYLLPTSAPLSPAEQAAEQAALYPELTINPDGTVTDNSVDGSDGAASNASTSFSATSTSSTTTAAVLSTPVATLAGQFQAGTKDLLLFKPGSVTFQPTSGDEYDVPIFINVAGANALWFQVNLSRPQSSSTTIVTTRATISATTTTDGPAAASSPFTMSPVSLVTSVRPTKLAPADGTAYGYTLPSQAILITIPVPNAPPPSSTSTTSTTTTTTTATTTTTTTTMLATVNMTDTATLLNDTTATPTALPVVAAGPAIAIVSTSTTASAATLLTGGSAALVLARTVGSVALAQRCGTKRLADVNSSASDDDVDMSAANNGTTADASLAFPLSLMPGFAVGTGPSRLRHHRGAFIANNLIVPVATVMAALLAAALLSIIRWARRRHKQGPAAASGSGIPRQSLRVRAGHTLAHSFATLRFPGVLIVVVGLGLDGAVASATTLSVAGEWHFLGAQLLLVLLLLAASAYVIHRRPVGFLADGISSPKNKSKRVPSLPRRALTVVKVLIGGSGVWVPDASIPFEAVATTAGSTDDVQSTPQALRTLALKRWVYQWGHVFAKFRGPPAVLVATDNPGEHAGRGSELGSGVMAWWSGRVEPTLQGIAVSWVLLDIFSTVVAAGLRGSVERGPFRVPCATVVRLTVALNVLMLVACVLVRPFNAVLKNLLIVATYVMLTAASAMMLLENEAVAVKISEAGSGLASASVGLLIARKLLWLFDRCGRIVNYAQKRKNTQQQVGDGRRRRGTGGRVNDDDLLVSSDSHHGDASDRDDGEQDDEDDDDDEFVDPDAVGIRSQGDDDVEMSRAGGGVSNQTFALPVDGRDAGLLQLALLTADDDAAEDGRPTPTAGDDGGGGGEELLPCVDMSSTIEAAAGVTDDQLNAAQSQRRTRQLRLLDDGDESLITDEDSSRHGGTTGVVTRNGAEATGNRTTIQLDDDALFDPNAQLKAMTSLAARDVKRTHEGQRLFDELEGLLRGNQNGSPAAASRPRFDDL